MALKHEVEVGIRVFYITHAVEEELAVVFA
jgi:hypothetical protein